MTRVAVVAGGAGGIGPTCARRLAACGLDVASVSPEETPAPAMARVRSALGSPGVLVNCVELDAGEEYPDDPEARFAVTRRNLRALFACGQAAAEHMVRNRWGRIITVAQPAAGHRLAGQAVLAGITGFTKSAALELTPFGVTVNFIAPLARAPETPGPALRVPGGEHDQSYAEGVSRSVEFLIGDQAGLITGQGLYVSGEPAVSGSAGTGR